MRDEVTVAMRATPEAVWALLSDVTRIGEFSPETFEARWTRGSTGPEVGAFFKGHVKRNGIGPVYWTLCQVTDCEPGRTFGFTVMAGDRKVNNWRYDVRPTPEGCEVTESFRLESNPVMRAYWLLLGWARRRTNVRGMQQTLNRVRDVVEATPARG